MGPLLARRYVLFINLNPGSAITYKKVAQFSNQKASFFFPGTWIIQAGFLAVSRWNPATFWTIDDFHGNLPAAVYKEMSATRCLFRFNNEAFVQEYCRMGGFEFARGYNGLVIRLRRGRGQCERHWESSGKSFIIRRKKLTQVSARSFLSCVPLYAPLCFSAW